MPPDDSLVEDDGFADYTVPLPEVPPSVTDYPLRDTDYDGLPDSQDYNGDTSMEVSDNHMDANTVWADDDGY